MKLKLNYVIIADSETQVLAGLSGQVPKQFFAEIVHYFWIESFGILKTEETTEYQTEDNSQPEASSRVPHVGEFVYAKRLKSETN